VNIDLIFERFSSEQKILAAKMRWPYLATKASLFLSIGAKQYREKDFFSEPHTTQEDTINLLTVGCHQVMEGKGLTMENPFHDLNVIGCSELFKMFHFEKISRQTTYNVAFDGNKGALDELTFKHMVDNSEITYYNFCRYV